ncbi:TetR/AcrR family transcriptional regulator [Prolixibacteraceae bacterium]|nr:TetR/AcrR family transcriptional regulator [Prolixibacteraceae bacterium]
MSDKREKVIEVASKLFSENGFDNTSINSICSNAGVSKGLVFHHFKNKDDLLKAVFADSANAISQFNQNKEYLPKELLIEVLNDFFRRLQYEKGNFKLSINISVQSSSRLILQDLIVGRSIKVQAFIQGIFEKMGIQNSQVKSYLFLAELDGIAMNYLYAFDNYPLEEVKHEIIEKYNNI